MMDAESQPLLSRETEDDELHVESKAEQSFQWKPVALSFLLTLVSNIGYYINMAPQIRLFESIVCTRHYSQKGPTLGFPTTANSPEESLCKIQQVQGLVAELVGMQTLFDGLVGILVGMYFGALADRVGRRVVFTLSTTGTLLASSWILFVCWTNLPIRLVWLSSAFLVVGGGSTVTNAVLTMVLTDATPSSSRSRVFLYFTASSLGSEVIAPPIASYFMNSNVWIPLCIGLCCTAMTVVIAMIIPETLPPTATKLARSDGLRNSPSASMEEGHRSVSSSPRKQDQVRQASRFGDVVGHIRESVSYMSSRHTLLLLVCIYMVSDFARQSLQYLLLYVSARYQVDLNKANYLLSWRAAAAIVLNTLILPAVDNFLEGIIKMHVLTKDATLARVSIVFLTLGFAVLAAAPSLSVVIVGIGLYTLGSSFGTFMRSIISILVEPRQIGTIYSTLSIMNTIGTLLSGPIMAQSLRWSARLDGFGKGMPYIISCVLCGIPTLVLLRLRVSGPTEQQESVESRRNDNAE